MQESRRVHLRLSRRLRLGLRRGPYGEWSLRLLFLRIERAAD